MIRKMIFAAGAMLFCGFAFAQVIDVREAHPGKDLTMEDAVYKYVGLTRMGRFIPKEFLPEDEDPIVWTDGNSLYCKEGPIAESTSRDISYGGTVSRNEFGFEKGWELSPSGRKVAFLKKDESRVTDFPLLDITTRVGDLQLLKYPMNGMDSELLSLGVYDMDSKETVWLQVDGFSEERYITNVCWDPSSEHVYAQVLDRSQHHMRLDKYSASSGALVRTILTEDNDAWVEPQDKLHFLSDAVFIYRTDNRDGYRNLYLVDTLGHVRRLTSVDADVSLAGATSKAVYYTSAEVSPVENHLFKIALPKNPMNGKLGKPQRLTAERGWHRVTMDKGCNSFLDIWSNLNEPGVMAVKSTDGKRVEIVHRADDPLVGYASCRTELGTVPSADGKFDNYYRLVYPNDFDPSKKYPLILYVYGGPHSQLVTDSWLAQIRPWEMLMAQKGYVVYVQDNRGTENRGAAFEKAINRMCGAAEMEDQMVGIRALMEKPWVDKDRIGVHGWSYGGFMTISLMTNYPEVFKVGVAGGPVIDWKWYEIMYGERYMDNPETNPEGFESTSLINKAPSLKGRLLICQGAVDDTVVWQHSLNFIQTCIDLGIPVDYFPYPVAKHNVMGRNRIHLMDKVTLYFEDYL